MASTIIIPVKTQKSGNKTIITREDVEERTMKDLGITEGDLEEFVRKNLEILFPDTEETLLIVGQQVKNKEAGRADLVAVDGQGNIVLIELKRDKDDIVARKEAFEFQAIRYAANYALIKSPQDLVQKLFAHYIEKHQGEDAFQQELLKGLTPSELAYRIIVKFLQDNQAIETFNRRQRVILIASSFDAQTLSACAWLAQNGIDIRCLAISSIEYDQQYFFKVEQVIPPPSLDEYFVEIAEPTTVSRGAPKSVSQPKRSLPRMSALFEWGLIEAGDEIYIRDHESEAAEIIDKDHVRYQGQQITYNEWGEQVTKWSAINIYEWTIHKKSNKTLDMLRREKLAEIEAISTSQI